ncbi:uncharacterized protein LOC121656289 [Melanotaenia boesemani]|uniref:uncharacterized protein LOC121656289 n=1 Tax=Melanotaenia boesemani TaxID=1250792 RepID=UPI001C03E5BB|nr:uncharacterized protein LOC121656289 [Melanotaenia boesemani]
MVCGLGLGVLLVLVQAEHVCCSWATKAWSSQDSNAGFSQHDGRLRKLDGSFPQNQVRHVLVSPRAFQRSSLSTETAVHSGSGPGLPTSSYKAAHTQPAWSSVRLQSSLVSKPSWQPTSSTRVNAQAVPKQLFGLSTAIASGSSVSKNQDIGGIGQKGAWPAQQGTLRASKYPSGAGQTGLNAILFSPVGPAPHGSPARMQTYARAPAKKVLINRGSKSSSFSPRAGKSYMSQLYPGTGTKTQESYKPSSTVGASGPGFAPVSVYEIPQRFGGSPIRRLRDPAEQDQMRIQKPQQTPTAPLQQMPYYKPQLPSVVPTSRWNQVIVHRGV